MSRLRKYVWQAVTAMLVLVVVCLSFRLNDARNERDAAEKKVDQVSYILNGEHPVSGYSCGVLDIELVREHIGQDIEKRFSQGPENLESVANWQDSCRYVNGKNNSQYAELFVSSYQTREQVEEAYEKSFQIVNDNKEYPAGDYGEELVYDAGVFYLRQDWRIIRIAASNGNPAEAETFALHLFEHVMSRINGE